MSSSKNLSEFSLEEKRALVARLLKEKANQTQEWFPLSYGQKALWLIYKLAPESAAYHIAFTARICSYVDLVALRQAFQALVNRHQMLRVIFKEEDGQPLQKIQQKQKVDWEEIDALSWSEEQLKQRVAEKYQQPFDLEQDAVMRVVLFHCGEHNHVLLLTIHHIACDGWSVWMLLDELKQLYISQTQEKSLSLPLIETSYQDYVRWQERTLQSEQGEKLWNYWKQQLNGELPFLNLPTDKPRPPVQTDKGSSYPFELSSGLSQQLKELARTEEVSLYMVLVAAFQILLYRYTHQEDILIGSATTGRTQAEFASLVGYMVNPVVLRANLSGNPTFKQFLSQVRQTVLGAITHQDYPFPLLVEKLQPNRDPSYSPLFQVDFVLQKSQHSQESLTVLQELVTWGDLKLEPFELFQQEGQFDLGLELFEGKQYLFGIFKYNTDLFDNQTIEKMIRHYQVLLEAIVENPEQRIAQLPLLTAAERHQILVEWNDTVQEYTSEQCIHQLFEEQVEKTPQSIAVSYENQHLTYRELNEQANQLAYYLQAQGVKPDVLIGICLERSLEMVIGLLGILKAGGAYVPLDPSYPQERLAYMLADSQVAVLLTMEKLRTSLPSYQGQVISLDTDFNHLNSNYLKNPYSGVDSSNLAYVIYTSGSTGKPKGAMNNHLGIVNRLLWMQQTYQLNQTDRVLQKTPFSFDVSVWEFFWPLMTGATLVMAKPGGHQDSSYLVNLIAKEQISTVHFVPSMLQVFLEEPDLFGCASLKRVICSGEALSCSLQERFFQRLGCELHNLYGPTEAAVDVSYWECQANSSLKSVPIGRPVANTQLYVLDPYLEPVPVGVYGELHIGGVQVGRGYLNREELTQEKFIPDPFRGEGKLYKTGDLARYLPDGNIEYVGRIDNQIKIRGFRIELGEIESILTQHSDVQECVVMARDDSPGNKRLVAYIVSYLMPDRLPYHSDCTVELEGQTWNLQIEDISTGGIGFTTLTTEVLPSKNLLVYLDLPGQSQKCRFRGRIAWVQGQKGGIQLVLDENEKQQLEKSFQYILRTSGFLRVEQRSLTMSLRHYLKGKLPDYMIPSAFVLLHSLPLTPNGKIDRRSLPSPDIWLQRQEDKDFVAPRTATEEIIAKIWGEVLKIQNIGIYDNFFELGGHSLLATQVVSRILETLQMKLPMRVLFEEPILKDLALRIDKIRATVIQLQTPSIITSAEMEDIEI